MTIVSVPPYPREYVEFARLFNAGAYYDAHEVLEDLWVTEVPPLRGYYKGLIMSSVALCHWSKGRPRPGRVLWVAARRHLLGCPQRFEGLDVQGFVMSMDALFAGLDADPAARLEGALAHRIPVVTFSAPFDTVAV